MHNLILRLLLIAREMITINTTMGILTELRGQGKPRGWMKIRMVEMLIEDMYQIHHICHP